MQPVLAEINADRVHNFLARFRIHRYLLMGVLSIVPEGRIDHSIKQTCLVLSSPFKVSAAQ